MLGSAKDKPSAEVARERALQYLHAAGASYTAMARLREEDLDDSLRDEVGTVAANDVDDVSLLRDLPGTRDPTPRQGEECKVDDHTLGDVSALHDGFAYVPADDGAGSEHEQHESNVNACEAETNDVEQENGDVDEQKLD
jgi:hypothetical protein